MIVALIIVVLGEDLCIYFPSNNIKLGIFFILGEFLLCLPLLLEGIQIELIVMDRTLTVLELFIVLVPWYKPIIVLYVPSE